MRKLLQKVDRIRATGMATLKLEPDSPHYHLSGKKFKVYSLGIPDYKCRITLIVDDENIDFTIDEIH